MTEEQAATGQDLPRPADAASHLREVPAPAAANAPGCLADWLAWATAELETCSDSARADAEVLLSEAVGCGRAGLRARFDEALPSATVLRLVGWIERRKLGEPVAYLVARCGFWSLDLVVDTTVLIPRPDTETLVERALARVPPEAAAQVLDLGTGSGAVALAIARERPAAAVIATDISAAALAVAAENAKANEVANVAFRLGDWFAPVAGQRFDLIVSNPPYIAEGDTHLDALRYEPRQALTSGVDGLDAIRRIVAEARAHLRGGGSLLLEHGAEQGAAVRALLGEAGLVDVDTARDLGGNERVSGGCAP